MTAWIVPGPLSSTRLSLLVLLLLFYVLFSLTCSHHFTSDVLISFPPPLLPFLSSFLYLVPLSLCLPHLSLGGRDELGGGGLQTVPPGPGGETRSVPPSTSVI